MLLVAVPQSKLGKLFKPLTVYVGWLIAVACDTWLLFPDLSFHWLTVEPFKVILDASLASYHAERLPPSWVGVKDTGLLRLPVAVLPVKVAVPFKVVVPVFAVSMAPPPPVDELLVNVDAPVMLRILAFVL